MFEILPLMSLTVKFWREMRSRTRRRECLQIDKQCINDWSAKPRLNQKQTTPYGRCFIGNGSVKWRRSQFLAALCRLWTVSSPVVSLPFPAYPTPATVHPRLWACVYCWSWNGCLEGVAVDWLTPCSLLSEEKWNGRAVWREYTSRYCRCRIVELPVRGKSLNSNLYIRLCVCVMRPTLLENTLRSCALSVRLSRARL